MTQLDTVLTNVARESIQQIDHEIKCGRSLPASYYVDPAIAAIERDRIFGRSWQYVCHVDAIRNSGDHAVAQLSDTPVIVVRGADGVLRGFVNACQHRLHPLATSNGNSRLLVCPYHAWTYSLDGRLKAAPESKREQGFDCAEIALTPVAVETWGSWVFANPEATATPLHELTTAIQARAESLNSRIAGYQFYDKSSVALNCNWKIWVENAIECYHCPALHRDSFAKAYASRPGEYNTYSTLDTTFYTQPMRWAPAGVDASALAPMQFVFLYPNTFYLADPYFGFMSTVVPTGPETCESMFEIYVNPDSDQGTRDQLSAMLDKTMEEDIEATTLVQRGYRSGRVSRARFMLAGEDMLQSFARRTWLGLRG